jgi:hypothetical protein
LENLCEIKEHTFTAPNLTYAKVIKIGKIAVLSVDSASYFNNKNSKDTLLQLPVGFAPAVFLNISANNLEGNFTNLILDETGKLTFKQNNTKNGSYLFTVAYVCK